MHRLPPPLPLPAAWPCALSVTLTVVFPLRRSALCFLSFHLESAVHLTKLEDHHYYHHHRHDGDDHDYYRSLNGKNNKLVKRSMTRPQCHSGHWHRSSIAPCVIQLDSALCLSAEEMKKDNALLLLWLLLDQGQPICGLLDLPRLQSAKHRSVHYSCLSSFDKLHKIFIFGHSSLSLSLSLSLFLCK